jgi:hypothetical protein
MFLGHIAVGLAGTRAAPSLSLGTWLLAVWLVDLIWPLLLLAGLEHVRISPGTTAFTPLDFYDYPITHSLVGGAVWAALLAGVWLLRGASGRAAWLLAAGVLSHWVLDAIAHRPDLPVFPHGPYVGLGLWHSVPATLAVELTMFAAGVMVYLRGRRDAAPQRSRHRVGFWALMAFLLVAYAGAAFGPPPPDVRTLAITGLLLWLLVPWAWWVDRGRVSSVLMRRTSS